jgi:hypothetical protein
VVELEEVNLNDTARVVGCEDETLRQEEEQVVPPVLDEAKLWKEDGKLVQLMQRGCSLDFKEDMGPQQNMGPIFEQGGSYFLAVGWNADADMRRSFQSVKALQELKLNELVFDVKYASDDKSVTRLETIVHSSTDEAEFRIPIFLFDESEGGGVSPLTLQSVDLWLGNDNLFQLGGLDELPERIKHMIKIVRMQEVDPQPIDLITDDEGDDIMDVVEVVTRQHGVAPPTSVVGEHDAGVEESKQSDPPVHERGEGRQAGGHMTPAPMQVTEEEQGGAVEGRGLRERQPLNYHGQAGADDGAAAGEQIKRRKRLKRKHATLREDLEREGRVSGSGSGNEEEDEDEGYILSSSDDDDEEDYSDDGDGDDDDDDDDDDDEDYVDEDEDEDEEWDEGEGDEEDEDEDEEKGKGKGNKTGSERLSYLKATVQGGGGEVRALEESVIVVNNVRGQRVPGVVTVKFENAPAEMSGGGGAATTAEGASALFQTPIDNKDTGIKISLSSERLQYVFITNVKRMEGLLVEQGLPELSAHVLAVSAAILAMDNRHRTPQELMEAYLELGSAMTPMAEEVRELLRDTERLNEIFAKYREPAAAMAESLHAFPQLHGRSEQVSSEPSETIIKYRLMNQWLRRNLSELQPREKRRRNRMNVKRTKKARKGEIQQQSA